MPRAASGNGSANDRQADAEDEAAPRAPDRSADGSARRAADAPQPAPADEEPAEGLAEDRAWRDAGQASTAPRTTDPGQAGAPGTGPEGPETTPASPGPAGLSPAGPSSAGAGDTVSTISGDPGAAPGIGQATSPAAPGQQGTAAAMQAQGTQASDPSGGPLPGTLPGAAESTDLAAAIPPRSAASMADTTMSPGQAASLPGPRPLSRDASGGAQPNATASGPSGNGADPGNGRNQGALPISDAPSVNGQSTNAQGANTQGANSGQAGAVPGNQTSSDPAAALADPMPGGAAPKQASAADPSIAIGSGEMGASVAAPQATLNQAVNATGASRAADGASRGSPAVNQIAVQVRHAAATGLDKIRIQLWPEHLGRVDVRLEIDDGGTLKALILSDSPETMDLLQRDARSLDRALQDAGLKTDPNSLQFGTHDRQDRGQQPAFDRQQAGTAGSFGRDAEPDTSDDVASVITRPGRTGLLDIQV